MDSTTGATTRRFWDGPPGRRFLGTSPPPPRVPPFPRQETTSPLARRTTERIRGNPARRRRSPASTANQPSPASRRGSAAAENNFRVIRNSGNPTRKSTRPRPRGNREPRRPAVAVRRTRGHPTPPLDGSRIKSPRPHSSGNPPGRAIPPCHGRRTHPRRPIRPCSPSRRVTRSQEGRTETTRRSCLEPPDNGRRRPTRIPPTGATIRPCSGNRSARSTSPALPATEG